MENLRVSSLKTEYFSDLDFNIEDVKKLVAPQIDSDPNNDETAPIPANDNNTENSPTENDTNLTNTSNSRKSWCC